MQISNIPRNYLLGAILMVVVVLIAITAFNPGSLLYKDTTDYETQRKLAEQQAHQLVFFCAGRQRKPQRRLPQGVRSIQELCAAGYRHDRCLATSAFLPQRVAL